MTEYYCYINDWTSGNYPVVYPNRAYVKLNKNQYEQMKDDKMLNLELHHIIKDGKLYVPADFPVMGGCNNAGFNSIDRITW